MTVKLLLDEQLPRQVAALLPEDWTVRSVQQMGWQGTKNGELIRNAINSGFTAMLTADKNLEYQQNLDRLPLPIIVIHAPTTRLQDLSPFLPQAIDLLGTNLETGIHNIR